MFRVMMFRHGYMYVQDGHYWKIDRAYGTEVIIYEAM